VSVQALKTAEVSTLSSSEVNVSTYTQGSGSATHIASDEIDSSAGSAEVDLRAHLFSGYGLLQKTRNAFK
jgi:hypothetical protein